MRILALDPGKNTGWARWTDTTGFYATSKPYDDALYEAVVDIRGGDYDEVVCEDFIITAQTAKKNSSVWKMGKELEFIGVIRWMCDEHGVKFTTQTPASRKFTTDAKLRKLDFWTPGPDHAREASRHLVLYLVETKRLDPRTLI